MTPWIRVERGVIREATLDRLWPGPGFFRVVALADLEALDLSRASCGVRIGEMTSMHDPVEWVRRARERFR